MGGGGLTSLSVISTSVGGGEWDTDVVQISMKNCCTKGSDSALESPSLAKFVSKKFSDVRGYLGGGVDVTIDHICVFVIWGRGGCIRFGSDLNKQMHKNAKR